ASHELRKGVHPVRGSGQHVAQPKFSKCDPHILIPHASHVSMVRLASPEVKAGRGGEMGQDGWQTTEIRNPEKSIPTWARRAKERSGEVPSIVREWSPLRKRRWPFK